MEFATIAAEIRTAAGELLRTLASIEETIAAEGASPNLYPRTATAIDDCLSQLVKLQLWGPENRLLSSELWNVAGHLLSRGWLQNQARTKPRGYAGDYEMLARIYQNRLCDDPLGQLFDQYFQTQAAPQAVRNRKAMMSEWIATAANAGHHSLRIAVVGSAFGLEIREALLQLGEAARARIHVTLLDVDPAAVDFGRAQLQPLVASEQLTTISTNLFRLPDRPREAVNLRGADLLLCAGMFDYLDDPSATAMLQCLFQQLAPGGRLAVFQFAPHNPTRAYMEWFGNWYLTYRDDEAFRRLIEAAGLSEAVVEFGAEPLGIDLFVTLRRR